MAGDERPIEGQNCADLAIAVSMRLAALRRLRVLQFGWEIAIGAGWDILLALYSAHGGQLTQDALCQMADVPSSSVHRWIALLEARGYAKRLTSEELAPPPIGLTTPARAQLTSFFLDVGGLWEPSVITSN